MPEEHTQDPGSVSVLIPGLRQGDREAIGLLWERFYPYLVGVARGRLDGSLRSNAHDVAANAFLSFCACVTQEGRFPNLENRTNLSRLLWRFTFCKAVDFNRDPSNRRVRLAGETLDGFPGREPPPEFEDEVANLLGKLPDDGLRRIALLRLKGLTRQKIADCCECSVPTVDRRLALIRSCWRADWESLMGAWKAKGDANANE